VANDVAQTGDLVSAWEILEPAVAENADNREFQEYAFSVAAGGGARALQQGDTATAQRLNEAALRAYQAAFGNATDVPVVRVTQAIAVYGSLGRTDEAIRTAQQATQRSPDNAQLWSVYATVLYNADRFADAAEALSRVISIDPNFENAYIRRGQAYARAGQRQQALADFERAAAAGSSETVAQVLYTLGAQEFTANNFADAASILSVAHQYATGQLRSDVAFVWSFALFRQGEAIARANTQGRAADAQRALEFFNQALPLARSSSNNQAAQVVSALEQYIANQEAIIRAQ